MRNTKVKPTDDLNKPTKDENGRPLGYSENGHWIWLPRNTKFRTKALTLGGATGRLIPYTTGTFMRPEAGPRGGRGYRICYRQVWYVNGLFCRVANVPHEVDGRVEWTREFDPIDGEVWNRYDEAETDHYQLTGGVLC